MNHYERVENCLINWSNYERVENWLLYKSTTRGNTQNPKACVARNRYNESVRVSVVTATMAYIWFSWKQWVSRDSASWIQFMSGPTLVLISTCHAPKRHVLRIYNICESFANTVFILIFVCGCALELQY